MMSLVVTNFRLYFPYMVSWVESGIESCQFLRLSFLLFVHLYNISILVLSSLFKGGSGLTLHFYVALSNLSLLIRNCDNKTLL